MERVCPRCPQQPLVAGAGALGESICGRCQGRFLEPAQMVLLCERHLAVGAPLLKELSLHGARRLRCPSCQLMMTEERLRGQVIDLCAGCGGAWLDQHELSRLTRGVILELKARPGPTAATSSLPPSSLLDEARAVFGDGPASTPRAAPLEEDTSTVELTSAPLPELWEIPCTHCDRALDVTEVNWLIDGRPWCAECARPLASIGAWWWSVLGGLTRWWSGPWWRGEAEPWSLRRPDTIRIEPADAERFLGSFRRRVPGPQPR